MKKREAKLTIVVVMLLVLALYFVGGTYARYASKFEGVGTVKVAKWAVALKYGQTSISDNFNVELTTESNANVVTNKIAPSYTASGKIAVDLSGTEVAVEVTAEVDETKLNSLPTQIKALYDTGRIKLTATVEKADSSNLTVTSTGVVSLPDATNGFTGTDTVVNVVVKAEWVNAPENDTNNGLDTAAGENVTTFSIPVKLTVQQHI